MLTGMNLYSRALILPLIESCISFSTRLPRINVRLIGHSCPSHLTHSLTPLLLGTALSPPTQHHYPALQDQQGSCKFKSISPQKFFVQVWGQAATGPRGSTWLQHRTVQQGNAWHSMARPALHSTSRHSTARHGMAWHTGCTPGTHHCCSSIPRGPMRLVFCLCHFSPLKSFSEHLIGNLHIADSFLNKVLMKVLHCVWICVCHPSRLTPHKSPPLVEKIIKGNNENLISPHLHKIHTEIS